MTSEVNVTVSSEIELIPGNRQLQYEVGYIGMSPKVERSPPKQWSTSGRQEGDGSDDMSFHERLEVE